MLSLSEVGMICYGSGERAFVKNVLSTPRTGISIFGHTC
jgi:hypothetical protein